MIRLQLGDELIRCHLLLSKIYGIVLLLLAVDIDIDRHSREHDAAHELSRIPEFEQHIKKIGIVLESVVHLDLFFLSRWDAEPLEVPAVHRHLLRVPLAHVFLSTQNKRGKRGHHDQEGQKSGKMPLKHFDLLGIFGVPYHRT